MSDFIPDVGQLVDSLRMNSPVDPVYFDDVQARLISFGRELSGKRVNAKLARQIHLASAFVATMFHTVHLSTNAGYLRWISDRDALVERHDGIVYDLAFLYFFLMASRETSLEPDEHGRFLLKMPHMQFVMPEKTGKHQFDELIRLADYLAGTLADVDINEMTWSKEKFAVVLQNVLVNSPNNWVVQMGSDGDRITARSIQLVA